MEPVVPPLVLDEQEHYDIAISNSNNSNDNIACKTLVQVIMNQVAQKSNPQIIVAAAVVVVNQVKIVIIIIMI